MTDACGLAYTRYRTGDSDEWMMRIGPVDGPPLLFVPPLFEEMNRIRAFLASMMRALAIRGYVCWLPDLPGTGESIRPLERCGWLDWRMAVADAGRHASDARPLFTVAVRGGCLLDDAAPADGHWRFAPVAGRSLIRDLTRAGLFRDEAKEDGWMNAAGYRISQALREAVEAAMPGETGRIRVVGLESDRRPVDRKFPGPALWRRSEPSNAPELCYLSTCDISEWFQKCGAS